jgi:predicted transcriptional regulator
MDLLKRGAMTPYEIAFRLHLNHKRTKEIVELMERSGFLESRTEDGRILHALSTGGMTFAERIGQLFSALQLEQRS